MINKFDLRIMADTFMVLMATEVLAKPIAIRVGRAALRWADRRLQWVPDWLYRGPTQWTHQIGNTIQRRPPRAENARKRYVQRSRRDRCSWRS